MVRKILVTGANGNIGTNVSTSLVQDGHRVRAFVRPKARASHLQRLGVEVYRGNILYAEDCDKAVAGCDTVVHLVGALFAQSRQELFETNFHSTRQICAASLRAGVEKILYSSSIAVYGSKAGKPSVEEDPCKPETVYCETKIASELELLRAGQQGKIAASVLRLGIVYGRDTRTIESYAHLFKTRRMKIVGKGNNLMHLVHIEDAVQAFSLAIQKSNAGTGFYNITDDEPLTQADFANSLADWWGQQRPGSVPVWLMQVLVSLKLLKTPEGTPLTNDVVKLLISSFVGSNQKANHVLGFKPKYKTFQDGLQTIPQSIS